jgi:dipeptide/tripeptide permease
MVLIWFGTFAVASQYTSASGLLGPMGIVAIIVGGGLLNKRIRDRLEEIYERRNSDANTDDSQSS